ncbi:MAG: transcription-repair coupling factor [Clostridia bacterium]|nr:transcription-repair coupling factor [Clostridia bacterium]
MMGKIFNLSGISDTRIVPYAAAMIEKNKGQSLIVTTSANRAKRIAQDLSFFASVPILVWPDIEPGIFRYEAKSTSELSARLSVLNMLADGKPCVVVASIVGALKKLPPAEDFFKYSTKIVQGSQLNRDDLIGRLAHMGYERVEIVEAQGQFAVRGDIVDIFTSGEDDPYRVEFFDTEVDSLRIFDAQTQRSKENESVKTIYPAQIIRKDEERFKRALKDIIQNYNNAAGLYKEEEALRRLKSKRDYLIDCIEEGLNFQYLENYINYFYEEPCFIWNYLHSPDFIMVDDPVRIDELLDSYEKESLESRRIILERAEGVAEDFRSLPSRDDYLALAEQASFCDVYYCTPFTQQIKTLKQFDDIIPIAAKQAPVFNGHMELLEAELIKYSRQNYKIVIVCASQERIINLKEFIDRIGLAGKVHLAEGFISQGIEYPEDKTLYLSEHDIFSHTKKKGSSKSGKGREIKAFTDIRKGDYVVHENHGIGRFTGVEKLEVQGSIRDYLKICYAGEDILYVPVDQMDSIQKYVGSESSTPKINRLSGGDWQRTKARAKASIEEMAQDFLALSAERELAPGYAFDEDSPWQKEFEDSFEYEETSDQLRAAEEIKKDMQSEKVMDRLLCGDVGYGKTEVAARAIFKCIEQGKQAIVLVPTTILANQHYHTFSERFSAYPFKVEMLSRFRNEKQQETILKKLKDGDIDVLVGTHRILTGDVKFKDPGLLIIDEEQRFGVKHKDAIKKLKKNVDVLALSATPIPRTLHMSLIGMRDMSLIEEPPENRYPVQTYVMEQDDLLLKDVISRELDRGGQVYIVYNRVRGINRIANSIREWVPDANVAVGHGQMGERNLENVMMDFVEGEYDILVSTTIIESGLDIPNVNTMIIMDADRLGLSQLYQLRGRVGRSTRLAYAYLVYKKDKVLSEVAEKRLRAIREFTEFGAGFRVAMRDLEIRGAGNILGVEQSGHMLSIGYELYCKLVEEVMSELKGEVEQKKVYNVETSVEISTPAYLPESYIADELTRLSMYKRIASIADASDKSEVLDELLDRFGDLPKEAENLLDISLIRFMASSFGINRVVLQQRKLVFLFEKENILTPEIFAVLLDEYGLRLTIFGGTEPRISLVLGKGWVTHEALMLLEKIHRVIKGSFKN